MFGWILLIFEICFVSAAYWYVFVREVGPYKIVGAPWGRYEGCDIETPSLACGEISRQGKVVIDMEAFRQSKAKLDRGGEGCERCA